MTIDLQARLDLHELLARYCHRVDHGDADGWAALFTSDGVFEVAGVMRLQGTEQLRTMPGTVAEHGGDKWRHQITSIVVEPGDTADSATVDAYGLVTNWGDGGKLVTFTDYHIDMLRVGGAWRIAALLARPA